jgi:ribosomal protein S18 acetylase RimI-like enzyme
MLYRVQKGDIMQASKVLADAFQHDPLWNKTYEGDPNIGKRLQALFEGGIRYCLKFGEVYAPSKDLEGAMGLIPGEYADMTWWRAMRSGTMWAEMRMGLRAAMKAGTILKPVAKDRRENMAGRTFLYVPVIGVATKLQGKGLGRKMIDAAIEKSELDGRHLYLDTETEENVRMYEHFGFKLLKRITLPIVGLPMWEMAREPRA